MASLEVNNLSDVELRSKLAECGHPVGPVTETTRKILIKKLKLLMKARNPSKSANRSLSRFSSGDESESDIDQNGGKRNVRRVSMPPPNTYKSTRRKTYVQNSSSDVSPEPASPKVTSSTPIRPSRTGTEVRVSKFFTPSALKQANISPGTKPGLSTSYSYDFESDSDDVDYIRQSYSPTRRSGPTYGTLSSYRSRLNNSYSHFPPATENNVLFSRLKNYNRRVSRPFLSNFVGKFSKISGANGKVSPQDVKETDDEDYSHSQKFMNMNIASRGSSKGFSFGEIGRPFRNFYEHLKSKDNLVLSSHSTSPNNSQWLSMVLLGLFLLFFLWLVLAYFKATQRPSIAGKSTNYNVLCSGLTNKDRLNCIDKDLRNAIQLYKQVHSHLQTQGLRSVCGPSLLDGMVEKPYMTQQEVIKFLESSQQFNDFHRESLLKGIKDLKLLILSNKHWGITLIKESEDFTPVIDGPVPLDKLVGINDVKNGIENVLFICSSVRIPWMCYIVRLFYNVLYNVIFFTVAILLVGAGLYGSTYGVRYYQRKKKEEDEQAVEMMGKIVNFFWENAENANLSNVGSNGLPSNYVAVRHLRDTLIPPADRRKMAGIWQKAVKLIEEHESRIRTEVQQVWGEETTVWRWVGFPDNQTQTNTPESDDASNNLYPDLSNLKAESKKSIDRVWQGEAFETSEGSMNALPSSFTQCLKIRHMFKHDRDYGPDWVVQIRDAIVEKCEGAKIVHLSVDQDSTEGCVYVKCASQKDAGLAYRQLHGSWFDGALITVKYLRLERYHERFPDSVYATVPLRPSNNLKLSLQGSSSAT